MEFFVVLFQTAVKMILLMAVAVGGISLGKVLRNRKDAKKAAVEEAEK
ncbi:MAG: hypothetical protein UDG86_14205 [Lachnospiraceae bacterium]|jgi:hypothetical protein|nr:hypothetical protein [Lachnospiraceae bacterium]